MYCSSCGVAVAQGLSFCNYCGGKLNGTTSAASDIKADSLIATIAAVFIFGLIGITVFMGVMKAVLKLPVPHILAFALVPVVMLVIIELVFIRLLLRRTQKSERTLAAGKSQTTNELEPARGLPPGTVSVTENTTRAFDPILTERAKRS